MFLCGATSPSGRSHQLLPLGLLLGYDLLVRLEEGLEVCGDLEHPPIEGLNAILHCLFQTLSRSLVHVVSLLAQIL